MIGDENAFLRFECCGGNAGCFLSDDVPESADFRATLI
jgi:hypothetical protein